MKGIYDFIKQAKNVIRGSWTAFYDWCQPVGHH